MADESTVRFLRWLLKRAEDGEIDGVAVVTTQPNSDDAKLGDTSWNGSGIERCAAAVIGNLEILKARLIDAERHDFVAGVSTSNSNG
jgi:hypothetical protein